VEHELESRVETAIEEKRRRSSQKSRTKSAHNELRLQNNNLN